MIDVAIIGSGVTGLSAALYAARYELSTIVIGDMLGGETATAWTVENYPGYESIDGYDLVIKMKDQVEKLGVQLLTDKVTDIQKDGEGYMLLTSTDQKIQAKTIILAVGAARKKLQLPREEELSLGKGIHYCTTCDGPLYKNKVIGIVGGGDAAVKGMSLAAQYATKIYSFVRADSLRAEPINYQHLEPYIKSGKIQQMFNTQVTELIADTKLKGVKLNTGEQIDLDGLFVEIGAIPEVELAVKIGVLLDDKGYIAVNNMMETNVPGVYAGGDTTNFFGHFKQIVTGCAMGSVAATSAFKHVSQKVTPALVK